MSWEREVAGLLLWIGLGVWIVAACQVGLVVSHVLRWASGD